MANDKKSELLGLNYSTAASSLRKQIIFHLAGALGLLNCYRCGEAIELDRFSIEHKDAWMSAEDPVASFFDMNNIAFSHLNPCNVGARVIPSGQGKRQLGNPGSCRQGHSFEGTYCKICANDYRKTDAAREYSRSYQQAYLQDPLKREKNREHTRNSYNRRKARQVVPMDESDS